VTGEQKSYRLEEFFPYYPNSILSGIGKAAVYALKYLLIYQTK